MIARNVGVYVGISLCSDMVFTECSNSFRPYGECPAFVSSAPWVILDLNAMGKTRVG